VLKGERKKFLRSNNKFTTTSAATADSINNVVARDQDNKQAPVSNRPESVMTVSPMEQKALKKDTVAKHAERSVQPVKAKQTL
jgi:hypothetical protein